MPTPPAGPIRERARMPPGHPVQPPSFITTSRPFRAAAGIPSSRCTDGHTEDAQRDMCGPGRHLRCGCDVPRRRVGSVGEGMTIGDHGRRSTRRMTPIRTPDADAAPIALRRSIEFHRGVDSVAPQSKPVPRPEVVHEQRCVGRDRGRGPTRPSPWWRRARWCRGRRSAASGSRSAARRSEPDAGPIPPSRGYREASPWALEGSLPDGSESYTGGSAAAASVPSAIAPK